MKEKMDDNSQKRALLMLSGGRDSFLTACRLVGMGYDLTLMTYDNGCISSVSNVETVADRLKQRFGEERIRSYSVASITCEFNRLRQNIEGQEVIEICKSYPHLMISQLNCLACHTAMYAHAIAQCLASDICVIAEGAREQQGFFVELPPMKKLYTELCQRYGIDLQWPVYDLKCDILRKEELSQWGFVPKSYEPQCWIGRPMRSPLTEEQINDLVKFYECEVSSRLDEMIKQLVTIKSVAGVDSKEYL